MADPRVVLQSGVEQGLHPGAQLYVSHHGKIVLDFACGEARPGIPMRTDSLVQWFSSGKPLTAICIAQFYEHGELLLDDKVIRYIPEFDRNGKAELTLWDLLTHTAGIHADNIPRHTPWNEAIELICDTPLINDWIPGETAAYSTQASWFVLAEIIRRIAGKPFPEYVRQALLLPLGMNDSWLSLPIFESERYGDRVAQMFDTFAGKSAVSPLQDAAGMAMCRPGASARGPVSQLARFYQMLVNKGELTGHRFLRAETIEIFTRRHRQGRYDQTFAHTVDYGLGFILNSNRYGPDTVPYGYGRYASEETFGHSGAQSSCAFADPVHDLIVAWVANGMPGERTHQQRQRSINNAIYEYAGLSQEG